MTRSSTMGGVLWDLDGTIADSAEHHYAAWREALAARGHAHTREEFARSFGKRNDLILRGIFGDTLTAEEIERISDNKEERYRRRIREIGLEPLPGVMDWLERLRAAGFKQAIASSAPSPNIEASVVVLGLRRFLDVIVSADEVAQSKPDPAIFLEAARRLGMPPGRCVVVEDAPAGIEGARRAGMKSVGILSAHHPELRADVVVPSLAVLSPRAFEELIGP